MPCLPISMIFSLRALRRDQLLEMGQHGSA